MNQVNWPEQYLPGKTDNFVSNEIIVADLTVSDVWVKLNNPFLWPSYYNNASDVFIYEENVKELSLGTRFRFNTFGFLVEAEVVEHVPPSAMAPARIAWHGWVEGDAETRLDVHHAWLFEGLSEGRVRLLTQETQIGKPAIELANTIPNPMLNAHQGWLNGLEKSARENM